MKISNEVMYSFDNMLIRLRFEDTYLLYVWMNYKPSKLEIVRSWDALNKMIKRRKENAT